MLKKQAIKANYVEALKSIYEKDEINALFKWISEDVIHLPELQQKELFDDYLTKLALKQPLQQVLGYTYFYNLKFKVNKHVLIPRPETEELVYMMLQECGKTSNQEILDIGTGSGCIAISLKKNLPTAQVHAIDVSEEALKIAYTNAKENGVEVHFKKDNALALKADDYPKFHIIVSNPPYIALSEKQNMHDNVVNFEPHLALFVEDDAPLIFYDKIADFALKNLYPNGLLFFEINQNLAVETQELIQKKGFKAQIIKDLNNNNRFIKAQLLG
ncbi:peptide chain release factor N(5)-glutamine methyltransferase [Pedobacter glucosidilyticus]|uniref:peptide chain release factor N(5)-glutamine methyltransferase n=1 Tax=Pedobacter glucosidilyticus TaxID=1122941 RepID=UPI0026E9C7BB|nr:peptide chain release factor N(5)-glutamine methyltransferase [Pedobacter glucosidilyticus]